jgi:hypothetical protein
MHISMVPLIQGPSWVPQWTIPSSSMAMGTVFEFIEGSNCASHLFSEIVAINGNEKLLGVSGAIIDKIETISSLELCSLD